MTSHSSILAWKIPWTEEPGGLQSMGSHRTGHNVTLSSQARLPGFAMLALPSKSCVVFAH